MNNHTDDTVEFYLVKIELWQIADSPYAPKFDIICKPNDWARTVKETAAGSQELTETKLKQLEFWTQFKEYAQQQHSKLRVRKPYPAHWTDVGIGYRDAYVALTRAG